MNHDHGRSDSPSVGKVITNHVNSRLTETASSKIRNADVDVSEKTDTPDNPTTPTTGTSSVSEIQDEEFARQTIKAEPQQAAVSIKSNDGGLNRVVSVDPLGNTYPEGGLRSWLVVYGSFSGMTAGFGLMNSIGTFDAWLSTHQLKDQTPSTIGWIFSLYTFLAFGLGIQIGPYFDKHGPRLLIFLGSLFLIGGTLGVAESTELWHFFLSFSIAGGIGTALIFTPAVASVAHFFYLKRGMATGLVATGGSFGGIVYPLMLDRLFPEIGFRWATRCLALIFLFQLCVANLLVRSRLPPPPAGSQAASVWPDWRIFRNLTFVLTTAGTFFIEWALFVPLTYLTAYALNQGIRSSLSYQLIAILNVGSFLGRWLPGIFADKCGRFNAMLVTVAVCILSVLTLWMTAASATNIVPQMIVFALIFGFGSGSNISLVPVCVGQLCATEVFGRWYASLYTIVSFGCLTGIPIAGGILQDSGSDKVGSASYTGLIAFVGACYVAGFACFFAARVREVGWSWKAIY